ncbi:MAG: hypothetical protein L6Q99_03520 [Planctomycetes bacterium]|nr:hypothetical protein [Planctomycetota bacterium]
MLASVVGSLVWIALTPAIAHQATTPTFRQRVDAFWKDVAAHADEYRGALLGDDEARAQEVGNRLGAALDELVPGLTFGAEPSASSVRFSLISGNDRTRQLLGREVAAAMPRIAGFECVPWRPPQEPERSLGTLGDRELFVREFVALGEWDGETPMLTLSVWHESLPQLAEEDRAALATHFVERALGDAMVAVTPHTVHALDAAPAEDAAGRIGGEELYTTLVDFLKSENFDAATPPELREEYYGEPSGDHEAGTRLAELLAGATRYLDVVADYNLGLGTETVDRLHALGANAVFVECTHTLVRNPFDEDATDPSDERRRLADELERELAKAHAGTVIGWGEGRAAVWLDLLVFDEARAVEIVKTKLAGEAWIETAQLCAFDVTRAEPLATLK